MSTWRLNKLWAKHTYNKIDNNDANVEYVEKKEHAGSSPLMPIFNMCTYQMYLFMHVPTDWFHKSSKTRSLPPACCPLSLISHPFHSNIRSASSKRGQQQQQYTDSIVRHCMRSKHTKQFKWIKKNQRTKNRNNNSKKGSQIPTPGLYAGGCWQWIMKRTSNNDAQCYLSFSFDINKIQSREQ